MHTVTIMSKPGCTLCDKVAESIRKIIRVPFVMDIVDITKDQDLLEKYRNDIPVVLVDGVERFRHKVDANELVRIFNDEPGERLTGIMGS
jgi:hypothetical protein